MAYVTTLRGERFSFADLRELLAKANEPKSGDDLAGISAGSLRERVAAKLALADVEVRSIVEQPLLDDDVTATVLEHVDRHALDSIAGLAIGELREVILSRDFVARWETGLDRAITPEVAAAVAKVMSDRDLITAAAALRVVTRCRNTMGERGVLGVRIQPNHPSDDVEGILLSTLDGLLFGCGDAVIGVNPVDDTVRSVARIQHALHEIVERLALPTQTCVLAHVTTQLAALRQGAPVDLLFQSLAGTQAANDSFGVTPSLITEGREAVLAHHLEREGFVGDQVVYVETGQGSALSAGAHHGIDQLTLEARAQALARTFDPFLVNSVVGFIGPEYLADARQITRAGLEDHFIGKLLGLPMGVDVCYTNHVDADQSTNDDLLVLLAVAGCNFVMGVPAGDDVMLHYQSTSYHDAAGVRELLGLRPAPEVEAWLTQHGLWSDGRLVEPPPALLGALGRGLDATLRALPA
jgi:ethanolamine ammonia-lyase large subunit